MHSRNYLSSILFFAIILAIAGCATETPPVSPPPNAATERVSGLLNLMVERLELMHDVARWKWNVEKAVNDPQREEALLSQLAEQAAAAGLEPEFARTFFQAQMNAAKMIQQADFDAWHAEAREKFADVPDLQADLRPKITTLSEQLITELTAVKKILATDEIQATLQQRAGEVFPKTKIDEQVWKTALKPLLVEESR